LELGTKYGKNGLSVLKDILIGDMAADLSTALSLNAVRYHFFFR
jgi:hypothetical protein